MLTLAETERFETEFRGAAEEEQLQLVIQPVDGPASYEFRRKVANGVECLALMYSPADFVLLRRHLSFRYVRFRERFWWLGFLMGRSLEDVAYHEVGKITHAEARRDSLVRIIQTHLPARMHPVVTT